MSIAGKTGAALATRADADRDNRHPQSERRLVEQVEHALELLQGKWKVPLVFLMARGVHRHCRLLEGLRGASKKMVTDTLRALERDGLVTRRLFAEVPLRAEYFLTPLGWALTEPLMALAEWDEEHGAKVDKARLRGRFGEASSPAPAAGARVAPRSAQAGAR